MTLTDEHIEILKNAGFKWYEISHFKAGRFNKISKQKVREMKALTSRNYNKPKVLTCKNGEYRLTNYRKRSIKNEIEKARKVQAAA